MKKDTYLKNYEALKKRFGESVQCDTSDFQVVQIKDFPLPEDYSEFKADVIFFLPGITEDYVAAEYGGASIETGYTGARRSFVLTSTVNPYWGTLMKINMVYRAYRVPYDWVPQLEKPEETPIECLDVTAFRVPGATEIGPKDITGVEGVLPFRGDSALCVEMEDEE